MRRLGLLALLAIAALGAGAAWMDSQISRPYRGHRAENVFVEIPHGSSRWKIAGILREDDVIRNRLAFAILSYWHFRHPLQAGEYYVQGQLTSRQLFSMIAHGRVFVHNVVIPEGWTSFDIANELERQGICSHEEFLAVVKDTSPIADFAPGARSLEGFLFPSTYEFTRHTTCEQVAVRMVHEFLAIWDDLNPAGSPTLSSRMTVEQVVTLASLVERETPNPDERPLIAGVFLNRIAKGIPLQCDPTVQYAWLLQGHVVQDLRPADLHVDSLYNTYQHAGLPPGPIANPGQAALRAALFPAKTDYLYFVANDDGGHFFSKTLTEHNRNVARYRKLLQQDAASAAGKSSGKGSP
ncbi:MAG TPA: endolytic transglycosylase MltG [Candidatus Micrarchaeaceae archaeon]|nr:endolytic transglycosylase MltG [Candidatus Micrarchaeaceae archaeon]